MVKRNVLKKDLKGAGCPYCYDGTLVFCIREGYMCSVCEREIRVDWK